MYSGSYTGSSSMGSSCPSNMCGLRNVGNTCFMNSILQCIFATPLLNEYFLKGSYDKDLNTRSPTKGKLAEAYAALIERVRSSTTSSESPTDLKYVVSRYAP